MLTGWIFIQEISVLRKLFWDWVGEIVIVTENESVSDIQIPDKAVCVSTHTYEWRPISSHHKKTKTKETTTTWFP